MKIAFLTRPGWTPAKRLAQSQKIKLAWAKRKRSIARSKGWTPERRIAQSECVKKWHAERHSQGLGHNRWNTPYRNLGKTPYRPTNKIAAFNWINNHTGQREVEELLKTRPTTKNQLQKAILELATAIDASIRAIVREEINSTTRH